jgi:hypothetical protein
MVQKPETKSVPIGLRVTPSFKKALDAAAQADSRPVASLVEKVLSEFLKKHGFLNK